MKCKTIRVTLFVGVFLSVLVALALAAQDRYTLKVPNGLEFSEIFVKIGLMYWLNTR